MDFDGYRGFRFLIMWISRPYLGIAPGGYSIHYTNTNPNTYPGLILDNADFDN